MHELLPYFFIIPLTLRRKIKRMHYLIMVKTKKTTFTIFEGAVTPQTPSPSIPYITNLHNSYIIFYPIS